MPPKTLYFVSPAAGLIAVTEAQEFGHRQFLLPGNFTLEVNGTQMEVVLAEGEQREIHPAFLKVGISNEIDIDLHAQISGNPLFVELNHRHFLNLNEVYPVLPGMAQIRLSGSSLVHQVELKEIELLEKTVHSVTVENDCPPWDWSCLGSKRVFLYQKEAPYPFAQGTTDVPNLFFADDIWVGIEGSRDIRYHVPSTKRDTLLKLGTIRFIPKHSLRPGQITDLARLESTAPPFEGHSLDLELERDVDMPVIAGSYYFSQFISMVGQDGERRRQRRVVQVRPGETVEIEHSVLVNEKKLQSIRDNEKKQQRRRSQRSMNQYSRMISPAIPNRLF